MTEHNTIVISESEYKDLVIQAERCRIIKAIVTGNEFITEGDLKAILDIAETEGENG